MLSILQEKPATPPAASTMNAGARTTPRLHNLPSQPAPFVGRAAELAEVTRRLQNPACRLLTLIGPGGIGKTRLALQVAQGFVDEAATKQPATTPRFADGVFFVSVQSVGAVSGLVAALAEATGFRFYSDVPQLQQVINFLREKQMLLVLDNLEQLPEAAAVVVEIRNKAPGVKLLITSRQALHVRDEWLQPLAGLTLPPVNDRRIAPATHQADGADAALADAVQLFVQSAHRVQAEFDPATEQEQIVRICRLVDGLPLALELAATWLKTLSCGQIADELEHSLDILTARQQSIPARHRSMVAVLEQSWQLLAEDEQAVLMRLSVFRGGFAQEAAREIADASLPLLAALVEKALVWVTPGGRYHMHELLRQFAQQQLATLPDEELATQAQHSAYYLRLLSTRAPLLVGRARRIALDEIGQEIDNVRLAWNWAAAHHRLAALNGVVEPLYHFYQIQSRYQEGRELFAQTWATLQTAPGHGDPRLAIVRVRVLARCGAFCHFLCEYELGGLYLQDSLVQAQRLGDRGEMAFALNFLGQLAVWKGDKATARQYLEQSLAISQESGDKSGAASALEKLANLIYAAFGEYTECKRLALQSLAFSRDLGRPDWIAYALDTLGFVTFCLGEYTAAEAHYRESLALFETIGDQYGMAMAQGGLGLVLWAMWGGKLVEATAFFQKSLQICRTIGHQGQVAGRLAGLARVANDLGEFNQAHQLGREGLAIARELGSPVYLSHILYCLGETAYRMGDLPTARAYLIEALQVTSQVGLLADLAIALYHYAALLIEESREAPDGATANQLQALQLLTLVQHHPATWQVYRDRAAHRLAQLAGHLPGATDSAGNVVGDSEPLNKVVAELLRQAS